MMGRCQIQCSQDMKAEAYDFLVMSGIPGDKAWLYVDKIVAICRAPRNRRGMLYQMNLADREAGKVLGVARRLIGRQRP